MSILSSFGGKKVYGSSWNVVREQKLSDEDLKDFKKAVIVDSQYGPSVCLHLATSGMIYFAVDNNSQEKANENMGKEVDLKSLTFKELEREDETCWKVSLD